MATVIIAKNNGVQNVGVEDLGIVIPPSSQRNLTENFTVYEVQSSIDLKAKVTTGDLVINDGVDDLSIAEGIDHITYQTKYEDHFDELVADYIAIGTTPPENGNVWINPADGYAYIYDPYRGKWLTTARSTYVFTKDGSADGIYLRVGEVANEDAGYYITKPATIVMVHAISTTGSDPYKQFSIQNNHSEITTFAFDNDTKYLNELANINLSAGTLLQLFVSSTGGRIYNAVVQMEVAWRYVTP